MPVLTRRMLSADAGSMQGGWDCVVVCLLQSSDGADTLGQSRIIPVAGHPFAQLVWAWSGAVATRGVDQAGDHADGSGVRQLGGRARLRPECSCCLGPVERADVAVAQPVVDEREQFACRGDLGDVAAAASFDALFVG